MGTLKTLSGISRADVRRRLAEGLGGYEFDQYRHYPATRTDAWQDLLLSRFDSMTSNEEWSLFWDEDADGQCLLAARLSPWDAEHFGFPVAALHALYLHRDYGSALKLCFESCIAELRARDVAFVSARVHGDQLPLLHFLENSEFRYYENIVWPVVSTALLPSSFDSERVRPMTEADLLTVVQIAERHQYQRGHFHCDPGFPPGIVDPMYGKWVRSAWKRQQPILVIDYEGSAVGYFVLEITQPASDALGHRYAGLRSLGLDPRARGKGLGIELFRGALFRLKQAGAEFVDSGYATKNHVSARLHMRTGFYSVYEEVTLHRWLRTPTPVCQHRMRQLPEGN